MSAQPMTKKQMRNWLIAQCHEKGHDTEHIAGALNMSHRKVIGILVRHGVYRKSGSNSAPLLTKISVEGF
jgi:hypothetical protein